MPASSARISKASWPTERRAQFNPLEILNIDNISIIEDAGAIAEAMVATSGQEKDQHNEFGALSMPEDVLVAGRR